MLLPVTDHPSLGRALQRSRGVEKHLGLVCTAVSESVTPRARSKTEKRSPCSHCISKKKALPTHNEALPLILMGLIMILLDAFAFYSGAKDLWEILKMAKDDSTVRCFQGLLIFGHVIVGMCGIALTAECIFFVSDQHSLYPLLEATNNDDIYGAAWIGMFVGICLFCLSVLAIVGIVKSNRKILLAYFIMMFIVYGFEVASCITAATQRDFFTTNLFLKQMLMRYQNNSPPTNDDEWKNNGVTKTWDRLMLQDHCCGVNGPSDWQKYTSAFRMENNDADYPWPRQCCVMNKLKEPLNLDACKLGVPGYYHSQGCYELISAPMDRHAWGVAWFGFAILCWTFGVLLGTMLYWSRIEY